MLDKGGLLDLALLGDEFVAVVAATVHDLFPDQDSDRASNREVFIRACLTMDDFVTKDAHRGSDQNRVIRRKLFRDNDLVFGVREEGGDLLEEFDCRGVLELEGVIVRGSDGHGEVGYVGMNVLRVE